MSFNISQQPIQEGNTRRFIDGPNKQANQPPPKAQPISFIAPANKATSKVSLMDWLGSIGVASFVIFGVIQLATPLIIKNKEGVSRAVANSINYFRKGTISLEKQKKLETLLSNRKAFEKKLKRADMALTALRGINVYQTAVNSKQPSSFLSVISKDIASVIGIRYPTDFRYSLGTLFAVLGCLGRANDIDNNNHPESRRDWNLSRITHFFPFHNHESFVEIPFRSFREELASFSHFIKDDVKGMFSLSPWRELAKTVKEKRSWTKPQGYQNIIASQGYLFSWLMTTIGLVTKNPALCKLAGFISLPAMFFSTAPDMARAWKNKQEMDGALVLMGTPLSIIGSLFSPQYFPTLFFLNGIQSLGSPLSIKGLELNSKRYRATVEEIEWIHKLALQNPSLKASHILQHFKASPNDLKILKKRLGRSRIKYLLDLLQQAAVMEQKGLPLTAFLSKAEYVKDPQDNQMVIRAH